jgi:hypothetical protein
MNRFLILLLTAIVTFTLVLLVLNPDLVNEFWLFVVGFAGIIVKGVKNFFEKLKSGFQIAPAKPATNMDFHSGAAPASAPAHSGTTKPKSEPAQVQDKFTEIQKNNFQGLTLTLLRYSDDGQTTLGLLYIDGKYFCITLEDTFREQIVRKETRIPSGSYEIRFRIEESPKQLEYRKRYPGWFKYHLELQDVPDFNYIYIHVGGNFMHTEGCILVSENFAVTDTKTFLTNSAKTFEKLYTTVSNALNQGKKVRIVIKDEKWFENIHAA